MLTRKHLVAAAALLALAAALPPGPARADELERGEALFDLCSQYHGSQGQGSKLALAPAIAGLKRVSKPGLRVYVGKGEIPRVYGGIGVAIVSTSKGVMVGRKAWREGVGGELLCFIW